MRKKLNTFACKHQKAYFGILALIYVIGTAIIAALTSSPWLLALIPLELFIIYAATASAPSYYIQESLKALEQCDPYPLLADIEKLERMNLSKSQIQTTKLNKASCLIGIGEFEKAKEILETVDVDLSVPLADGKFVYYNNLAAVYEKSEENTLCLFLSKKALFIYDCMKESQAKKKLYFSAECLKATICRLNKDYSTALAIASAIIAETPYQLAQKAYECALAYRELKDFENEKSALFAVMARCDKLYIAKEAQKRIEEL